MTIKAYKVDTKQVQRICQERNKQLHSGITHKNLLFKANCCVDLKSNKLWLIQLHFLCLRQSVRCLLFNPAFKFTLSLSNENGFESRLCPFLSTRSCVPDRPNTLSSWLHPHNMTEDESENGATRLPEAPGDRSLNQCSLLYHTLTINNFM
jgi:hypothetical protein